MFDFCNLDVYQKANTLYKSFSAEIRFNDFDRVDKDLYVNYLNSLEEILLILILQVLRKQSNSYLIDSIKLF